jgi:two-component system cell cycle response regulator DivK
MRNRTVLLVDDCPENLKLLTWLLKYSGYTVLTATGGTEALAQLAQAAPEGVLTDIQMPGMSGLELTRLIRSDPRTAEISILAISANAMQENIDEAYQAGCDGYITKPIDTRTFAADVGTLLDRGRSKQADLLLT